MFRLHMDFPLKTDEQGSIASVTALIAFLQTHKQELIDMNTIMFVAIHELAHIMTKSVGHTEEFWSNMRYLLKKGIKVGVYTPHDYKNNPVRYCGIMITDSPLEGTPET